MYKFESSILQRAIGKVLVIYIRGVVNGLCGSLDGERVRVSASRVYSSAEMQMEMNFNCAG